MNLHEETNRIKQMMGVINEDMDLSIRRRIGSLPSYIKSSYAWLNPKAFVSFDEFIERVIFSTTRDFVADLAVRPYEEQLDIRDKVYPLVRKMVEDEFMDEIRGYFISERN